MKDYSIEFEKLFYKEGTLEERQSIKSKLSDNPEMAKAYNEYLSLMNHINKRDRVNQSLEVLQSVHKEYTQPRKVNSRRIWVILGMVLLSLGVLLIIKGKDEKSKASSTQELYASFYQKPEIDLNSRSQSSVHKGIEYYQNNNFKKAIVALDTTSVALRDQSMILFAKSIAIHEQNSLEQAQKEFDSIAKAYPSMKSTMSWYKALNFLKHNDPNQAKKQLMEIGQSSSYYQKALDLLKRLK